MMRTYFCTHCKHPIFTGNLKALMAKRHAGAPSYIHVDCGACGHVNQLRYDPTTEVQKRKKPKAEG